MLSFIPFKNTSNSELLLILKWQFLLPGYSLIVLLRQNRKLQLLKELLKYNDEVFYKHTQLKQRFQRFDQRLVEVLVHSVKLFAGGAKQTSNRFYYEIEKAKPQKHAPRLCFTANPNRAQCFTKGRGSMTSPDQRCYPVGQPPIVTLLKTSCFRI